MEHERTEIFWDVALGRLTMQRFDLGIFKTCVVKTTVRYARSGAEMFPFAQRYIPKLHSLMVIHES